MSLDLHDFFQVPPYIPTNEQSIELRFVVIESKDVAMGDWRPFVYGGLASITAEIGTVHKSTTKISHVALFLKMRRGEGDSSKKSLQHILNHENPNLGV